MNFISFFIEYSGFIIFFLVLAAIVCYFIFAKKKSPQPFWVLSLLLISLIFILIFTGKAQSYEYISLATSGIFISWCLGILAAIMQQ